MGRASDHAEVKMARWTDIAAWRGPTENQGGPMVEHRGVVLHIAEGWYEGTITWQRNPSSEVSSHFMVGRDPGQVAQLVDTDVTAWTQVAGNGHWLSIEFEGFSVGHHLNPGGWDRLSAAQIEAAAKIVAKAHDVYGMPLQATSSTSGRGLGHHSMGGASWGGHYNCPGPTIIGQKSDILARARELTGSSSSGGGGTPPPEPAVEFPLPAGWYFGPVADPTSSVSGVYRRRFKGKLDREWLRKWARQLRRRGWPIGKGQPYLTRYGNDGIYGSEYAELARAFQADQGLVVDGLIGIATWLAAYQNPVS